MGLRDYKPEVMERQRRLNDFVHQLMMCGLNPLDLRGHVAEAHMSFLDEMTRQGKYSKEIVDISTKFLHYLGDRILEARTEALRSKDERLGVDEKPERTASGL